MVSLLIAQGSNINVMDQVNQNFDVFFKFVNIFIRMAGQECIMPQRLVI